jgi:ATP-binding cassette subfamily B protein
LSGPEALRAPGRAPGLLELLKLEPRSLSRRLKPLEEEEEARYKPLSWALVRRLAVWLKPYWKLYLFGVICGVVGTLLELVPPWVTKKIIESAHPGGSGEAVLRWAGLWAGAMALVLVLDALQMGATNRCGQQVVNDLRLALFAHLQRLSMSFYDKTKLGRIITRATSDMDALRAPVISGVNTVVLNAILMVGAGAMIALTSWQLFLAVFWLAPLLGWLNRVYRRRVGEQYQVVRAHFSRIASNLAENITGVRVVSAFNRQEANLERFNQLQDENTLNNMRVAHLNGLYQPLLQWVRFAGQAVILAYGGVRVMRGQMGTGEVIMVFFYWDAFMRPTINVGNFYNQLMQAMASGERIFALLDMQPEVQDRPDARPLPKVAGHIRYDHVTFGYDPGRPVLHDICLEIPAGKTYALVGATGSGKSTMVSLLARFYELQRGAIFIDGHDVRSVTLDSLHRNMGMVLQSNHLFSGTVLDNIRYPRPGAGDEEVYAAARALGVHSQLLALPNGYRTMVGERGASVSMGLRQLVCFARVLLADPRVFLLDEATAAIDTVTERQVQAALEKVVRGRTTLIVAHRLSTVVKADCIVVLDQGRIIEQGRHGQLLAARGHYARLYERFASAGEVLE